MAGSSAQAWPVEEVRIAKIQFFRLAEAKDIHFLPIVNPKEWSAMPFSFKSPLTVRAVTGKWHRDNALLALPMEEPDTLLRVAARRAFWDIPTSGITKIGQSDHVGATFNSTDDLPTMLLKVCGKVLGPMSDEEQLN